MPPISRRAFVTHSAAILSLSQTLRAAGNPHIGKNLGVQLYTVRNVIMKDPVATLKAIQDIGYTEIEATYNQFDKLMDAMKQTHLKGVSCHVDGSILNDTTSSKADDAMADLKKNGFDYVVYPYVPPNQRGGMDVYKKMAASFNRIGEKAKSHGLQFCYHNHAFEFQPMDGTMPLNTLLGETDKKLVGLEMDIFWVSVAGHDPVQMLQQYGDRVHLLHLKDKAADAKVQYNEMVPKGTFKEVGSGTVNIPAVLEAATKAHVSHYFVEQDQTPGDPIESLRTSYQYLSPFLK